MTLDDGSSKIVPWDERKAMSGNMTSFGRLVYTEEHMQVPYGKGPGVRRS